MTKHRILFVVPSLRRAGAENQVVQLANGLRSDRYEKHLVFYLPEDELRSKIDEDSVTVHVFPRRSKVDSSVMRSIAELIDEAQIDIVHCTLENALLYGGMASFRAGRDPALICALHTTKHVGWKHIVADAIIYRHLLRKCDQVWFMSEIQASIWIQRMKFLGPRAAVVHNGIDSDAFDRRDFVQSGRSIREQYGIPYDARVLCSIAGFRPVKLHAVLLRAIRRLNDTATEKYYLLLAGSGPLEPALRRQVVELGLENEVLFLGEVSDVRPVLAAADCKLLASEAETFSMAMLEAMAMEVPVIATSVGGSGEAIQNGETGFLVAPGDMNDIIARVGDVFSSVEKRLAMGRRARQVVIERFSRLKMIETSTELLDRL